MLRLGYKGGAMASVLILVIEDERDILDMLRELLEEEGHHVVCVNHPRQLTPINEEYRPDLLFVDLMLPDLSGIELARRLREDGFPDTPMVAMSASPDMLRSAVRSNLFQETLPKPFDIERLLSYAERYAA